MSLTIFQKGVIIVALPLVTQGVFVGILAWFQGRYADAQTWSAHTDDVIELGRQIETKVVDIQSGSRGFAVTGNRDFLKPIAALSTELEHDADNLPELVSDNSEQRDRAQRIALAARQAATWYAAANLSGKTATRAEVAEQLNSGVGSQRVESLRHEIREFLAAEERLDKQRAVDLERARRTVNALLIASAATSFLGTVILALLFSRGIGQRLKVLSENTRRLAAGDELLASVGGADEIAATDRAFRQMAADLDQMASAQRRDADRIRDLYNLAPCGYHSVDADGVLVAINDTELAWLGKSRADVEGKAKFTDFLTQTDRDRFTAAFPMFKERGVVTDLEFDLIRADGSLLPVSVSATAIRDEGGRYVASRSTLFDITERRRAEAAVHAMTRELERRVAERTAELTEANRELAQKNQENELFVYSVSHDLRSPLVNLQGFGNELAKGCDTLRGFMSDPSVPVEARKKAMDVLDGRMSKGLGFIHAAVARLGGIIDALLRLSRAGRVEYRWEQLDLQRIVAQIVASLHGTIKEKGAEIRVGDLPAARGDATAIGQVFANLIGNALIYLDPKRAGLIEIDGRVEEDGAPVYAVRDNGMGIPAKHHQKVFQLFQRVHPGVGQGEGLGLAIVARIVERHRGKVWVESREGEGSVFFVRLQPPSAA